MDESMDTVVVTRSEYESLLEARAFLDCLDACGVDNWSGYSDAQQMFNEEEED